MPAVKRARIARGMHEGEEVEVLWSDPGMVLRDEIGPVSYVQNERGWVFPVFDEELEDVREVDGDLRQGQPPPED